MAIYSPRTVVAKQENRYRNALNPATRMAKLNTIRTRAVAFIPIVRRKNHVCEI